MAVEVGDPPVDFAGTEVVREHVLAVLGGRPSSAERPLDPPRSSALLLQLLAAWRILPTLSASYLERSLAPVLVDDDYKRLRNGWLAVSAFAKAQLVASSHLLEELEGSGIRYSVLKGLAAGFRLYEHPYHRASTDVDIGVYPGDLPAAEAIARRGGFHPAQKNERTRRFEPADPGLRALVEARHYELCFFVRRLQVTNLDDETVRAIRADPWAQRFWLDSDSDAPWCYAIVDVHHALSLDIPLEELLKSARPIDRDGTHTQVPDDTWLAAHLIYKLYWEGVHNYGKGLYQYADLVRLVPDLDRSTFDALVGILEEHNLVAAGHYVLRRVPQFGTSLPDHVAQFVEGTRVPPGQGIPAHRDPFERTPRLEPGRLNDKGDMWARLWGHR